MRADARPAGSGAPSVVDDAHLHAGQRLADRAGEPRSPSSGLEVIMPVSVMP